jgi:hypothetical protein
LERHGCRQCGWDGWSFAELFRSRRSPGHAAGSRMSTVMIRCPHTGRAISTGIEIDLDSFRSLPTVGSQVECPACGGHHVWKPSDAWLSQVGDGYGSEKC